MIIHRGTFSARRIRFLGCDLIPTRYRVDSALRIRFLLIRQYFGTLIHSRTIITEFRLGELRRFYTRLRQWRLRFSLVGVRVSIFL